MKKSLIFFSYLMIAISTFAFSAGEIDKKFLQLFSASFPAAEKVNWYETPDAFIVNFEEEGVRVKAIYEKDESYVRVLRYYPERNLPFYVRIKIKKAFPQKTIFGVTELSTIWEKENFLVEYYIKLETDYNWTTVRVDNDGNMMVIEKYKKAL